MQQAQSLGDDEAAATDFILQCNFAEVRLAVSEHIHSRPMLEKIRLATLKTDRRVAKLMQSRLDALRYQDLQQKSVGQCMDAAQQLLQDPKLTPNHVADLDRTWQAIGSLPESARCGFDALRAALAQRLLAQTVLQRTLIDALTGLRSAIANADRSEPEEMVLMLQRLADQVALCAASGESASLPKILFSEFAQKHLQLTQDIGSLTERHVALTAREAALGAWENALPESLKPESLQRTWQALPELGGEALEPLAARFDALMQQLYVLRKTKLIAVKEVDEVVKVNFSETLEAMEAALHDGLLQAASEQDRLLRAIDLKKIRVSEGQTARLGAARAELKHLQDWAKWGGNVSREELIRAVEELPSKKLGVTDLARKVGSLRERWKSLDGPSGQSPRSLWERFDAACTTAYAPAAAHFKKLSEERHANLAGAQSLLGELAQSEFATLATGGDLAAFDWKGLAGFCQRMDQAWGRLGPLDRKDKKRLDGEFDRLMQTLRQPLEQQRLAEVARREMLIGQAEQLKASDRNAIDTLRTLQERWQEQAKLLPLARKDEQALWQRFRGACDAVFARRKESAEAADDERRQSLAVKEALCATLEQALQEPVAVIARLLRESQSNWANAGAVPRASEKRSEQRYQLATAALQAQMEQRKRDAVRAQNSALQQKIGLCQAVEAALSGSENIAEQNEGQNQQQTQEDWAVRWQQLPALSAGLESAMRDRFDAALGAFQAGDRQYADLLRQNSSVLSLQLLQLEIISGLDSPPELSRQRLKIQVEVLQSSLKLGQKPVRRDEQILSVCRLPALADQQSTDRVLRLLNLIAA